MRCTDAMIPTDAAKLNSMYRIVAACDDAAGWPIARLAGLLGACLSIRSVSSRDGAQVESRVVDVRLRTCQERCGGFRVDQSTEG